MQSNGKTRVLGVDPGTLKAGYAVVEDETNPRSLEHGTIVLQKGLPLEKRLHQLHLAITGIIARLQPDAVAVEEPFVGKSAHTAIAIGQAQGVVLVCAEAAGLPVMKYAPAKVKFAVTNSGRASKDDMIHMTKIILRLEQPPQPDAADALAVALCHMGNEQERRASQQAPGH